MGFNYIYFNGFNKGLLKMIDQELIDRVQRYIDNDDDLNPDTTNELLSNYIKVIEDNARIHKELAKLRNRLDVIESS